jgi:hypothetical protein
MKAFLVLFIMLLLFGCSKHPEKIPFQIDVIHCTELEPNSKDELIRSYKKIYQPELFDDESVAFVPFGEISRIDQMDKVSLKVEIPSNWITYIQEKTSGQTYEMILRNSDDYISELELSPIYGSIVISDSLIISRCIDKISEQQYDTVYYLHTGKQGKCVLTDSVYNHFVNIDTLKKALNENIDVSHGGKYLVVINPKEKTEPKGVNNTLKVEEPKPTKKEDSKNKLFVAEPLFDRIEVRSDRLGFTWPKMHVNKYEVIITDADSKVIKNSIVTNNNYSLPSELLVEKRYIISVTAQNRGVQTLSFYLGKGNKISDYCKTK